MTCLLDIGDFDEVFFEKTKAAVNRISKSDRDEIISKSSVYGKALLGYVLKKNYDIDFFSYCFGENGKPYLENEEVFFNISHSGSLVLCTSDKSEVGCDVEKVQFYKSAIAKRFFTEKEFSFIENSDDKNRTFIRLWTLKESILKKQGTGIGGGLKSYDFSGYLSSEHFSNYGYRFSCFSYKDYEIAVCGAKVEQSLQIITEDEFEKYLDSI